MFKVEAAVRIGLTNAACTSEACSKAQLQNDVRNIVWVLWIAVWDTWIRKRKHMTRLIWLSFIYFYSIFYKYIVTKTYHEQNVPHKLDQKLQAFFGTSRFNRLIARNHFFHFSLSFSEGIRKNFLSGPQLTVQSTTQQEWTILFSKSSSKRAKQSNYRYLAVFPATRFPWCNATNINNDVTKDPPIDSLCQCIDKINSWMCQSFLQLNKEKTEVIAFGNKHEVFKVNAYLNSRGQTT